MLTRRRSLASSLLWLLLEWVETVLLSALSAAQPAVDRLKSHILLATKVQGLLLDSLLRSDAKQSMKVAAIRMVGATYRHHPSMLPVSIDLICSKLQSPDLETCIPLLGTMCSEAARRSDPQLDTHKVTIKYSSAMEH